MKWKEFVYTTFFEGRKCYDITIYHNLPIFRDHLSGFPTVELMTENLHHFIKSILGQTPGNRECGHDTVLKKNFTIWIDKTEQSIQLD